MALCIVMKNAVGKLVEVTWNVGTPSPFIGPNYSMVYVVGEVFADGKELEYLKVSFTNLPSFNGKMVRYFGDHAKFIAGNLP